MSNNQVLSDLIKFRNENIKDNRDSSLIYISTANMNPERNGISLEDNDSLGKSGKKFYKGDVLVSNIRPYFKKIWKADRDGISSADVLNFIPIEEDMIDKTYLYYLLSADTFFGYMTATAKGTKMPRGDKKALEKYEVRSLKLSEQKLIANILSSFDDKIENNNAIIANLEEQAQTIFKSWFVDFEPFQDGEFVESDLGDIPKGWSIESLGDIVNIYDSERKPLSQMVRQGMDRNYPYYGANGVIDYVEDYLFDGKYLLLGEDGTVQTNEGYPILNYIEEKFWVSNHAHIMTGDKISTEFLYVSIKRRNIRDIITGAVQQKINQRNLKSIKLVIPESNILINFQNIIEPIFEKVLVLKKSNKKLEETRDILLPKLMSGEIRVEETIEVEEM